MALTLIAAFIGAIVGLIHADSFGALVGALVAALCVQWLHFSNKLNQLQQELQLIKKQLAPNTAEQRAKTVAHGTNTGQTSAGYDAGATVVAAQQAQPIALSEARVETIAEPVSGLGSTSTSATINEPAAAALTVASPVVTSTAAATTAATSTAAAANAKTEQSRASNTQNQSTQTDLPDIASGLQKLLSQVQDFIFTGNPLVKVGMLILFIGLSFLAKYVSASGLLPLEARLAGLGLVGFALLGIGWRTRHRQQYGLVLQGGGLAVMYLTIFMAAKLYPVLSLGLAFSLMLAVVIAGVYLAVKQQAQILALFATAGGFLVPLLTSDGSNNYVGLFTYYALLNAGLLVIAWFKAWRQVNICGFIFTFGISLAWCLDRYQASDYLYVQPFIALYFFMYLAVMVLFSLRQPPNLKGFIDGSLMFGLPILTFGQQLFITHHLEHGDAYSALSFACVYGLLAIVLKKRLGASHALFTYSLTVLAVGFATLLIPLLLNAKWTSVSFAIEAVALIWLGFKQNRPFTRWSGLALYGVAAIALLASGISAGATAILSGDFLNLAVMAFSGFAISRIFDQHASGFELKLSTWLFYLALIWWLGALHLDIFAHARSQFAMVLVLTATLSVLLLLTIAKRLAWRRPQQLAYGVLAFAGLLWFNQMSVESLQTWQSPFSLLGTLTIALVFGFQYRWLYREAQQAPAWHFASAYTAFMLLVWQVAYWQQQWQFSDTALAWLALLVLVVPLLIIFGLWRRQLWPVAQLETLYLGHLQLPWHGLLLCVAAFSAVLPQLPTALALPIFNSNDAVMLLSAAIALHFCWRYPAMAQQRLLIIAGVSFLLMNVVLLRSLHHYLALPYELIALLKSAEVQMALSIFWALLALSTMLYSSYKALRMGWLLGLGFMAIVIAKLFLVDLAEQGSLTRIVSFVSVGGLMLLIGYFSPIPPKEAAASTTSE